MDTYCRQDGPPVNKFVNSSNIVSEGLKTSRSGWIAMNLFASCKWCNKGRSDEYVL